MARLFLKIFYTFFLWILLLANLFIFFDMVSLIINPLSSASTIDLSDKYFGVSTFINALRNIDKAPFGKFVTQLGHTQTFIYKIANTIFSTQQIDDVVTNFGTASNVLEYLRAITSALFALVRSAVSSFFYIFAFVYSGFYFITLVLNFVYYILGIVGGQFVTPVPHTGILDSMMVASNISNCITPLVSAVVGV